MISPDPLNKTGDTIDKLLLPTGLAIAAHGAYKARNTETRRGFIGQLMKATLGVAVAAETYPGMDIRLKLGEEVWNSGPSDFIPSYHNYRNTTIINALKKTNDNVLLVMGALHANEIKEKIE